MAYFDSKIDIKTLENVEGYLTKAIDFWKHELTKTTDPMHTQYFLGQKHAATDLLRAIKLSSKAEKQS